MLSGALAVTTAPPVKRYHCDSHHRLDRVTNRKAFFFFLATISLFLSPRCGGFSKVCFYLGLAWRFSRQLLHFDLNCNFSYFGSAVDAACSKLTGPSGTGTMLDEPEAVHAALSRIYTLTSLSPPSRHHAVFKAPHPARLHPSGHPPSARLSHRASHPFGCHPPELARTRAQRHIWSGRLGRIGVLYQHHSGRTAVLRLNRHGQVKSSKSTLPTPLPVLTSRFLWYKTTLAQTFG